MKVFVQDTRVALISQFQHLRNYCITWCSFASIFWILAAFHSITWWEVIEVLMSLRLKSIHPKYFWTSLAWINMRRGASMRQALFEALSARRAHAHQSPSLQSLMTPLLKTDQHVANVFQQVLKKALAALTDCHARTVDQERVEVLQVGLSFLEPWLWLSREENTESWWNEKIARALTEQPRMMYSCTRQRWFQCAKHGPKFQRFSPSYYMNAGKQQ